MDPQATYLAARAAWREAADALPSRPTRAQRRRVDGLGAIAAEAAQAAAAADTLPATAPVEPLIPCSCRQPRPSDSNEDACGFCGRPIEEVPVSQAAQTSQTISQSIEGTISLRPTDEGFASIAERFASQILIDVSNKRRESDRLLLDSLVEIVAYLAQTDPKLVAQIRAWIVR